MGFAIFLDVDGVLNTKTTVQRTPDGCHGVDEARVEMLAKAIRKYGGGKIILSSDWKELKEDADDYVYLVSKLDKYGLRIEDKTVDKLFHRGKGIMDYLEQHKEIDEFVILDDNVFDFRDYDKLWERLLLTNGLERAKFASSSPAIEAILFLDYLLAAA